MDLTLFEWTKWINEWTNRETTGVGTAKITWEVWLWPKTIWTTHFAKTRRAGAESRRCWLIWQMLDEGHRRDPRSAVGPTPAGGIRSPRFHSSTVTDSLEEVSHFNRATSFLTWVTATVPAWPPSCYSLSLPTGPRTDSPTARQPEGPSPNADQPIRT